MHFSNLLYEKENGIAIVTLNRPNVMNALNEALLNELYAVTNEIAADDDVKAVVLTGGDKVFGAGGDIGPMATMAPLEAERFVNVAHRTSDSLANLEKPVIAAITGLALGGACELALCCDIRIAAEGTKFGLPELGIGIFPGGGGTQRLTRLVGSGWAKHMVMTAKPINTDTAFNIGLVTKVVPQENLMDEAKKLAFEFASRSAIAMKMAKKCINNGENVDLSSGCLLEREVFGLLMSTEDAHEGLTAFMEKRKPVFKQK